MWSGLVRPLPDRAVLYLQGWPGIQVQRDSAVLQCGGVLMAKSRPTVAVYKFSSCDGCQLSLLNMEDELLDLAAAVDLAYFLEATRVERPGPYDIALVEGSISTEHEAAR